MCLWTGSNLRYIFLSTPTFWVYILQCSNGSYYTGYTLDLTRRYQEHITGTAKCKYTRSFKPVGIAQSWQTASKTLAMQAESFIKKLSKNQKKQLILNPEQLEQCLHINSKHGLVSKITPTIEGKYS